MTGGMHPNLSVLEHLNLRDLDASKCVIAEDFVFHYFNPHLSELDGDHCGLEGLKAFFAKLGEDSTGTFHVNVVDARPAGDELVVTQVCNRMTFEGRPMEFDAVVVWRIVNGKIAEAWDIPAVNTIRAARTC